jgi:hypothetical protein
MLKNVKNISPDPPGKSMPNPDVPVIPDPWECSNSGSPTPPLPKNWKFPIESHLSIAPPGCPEALLLGRVTLSSLQVLLQDWLKLGVDGGKSLSAQLQQAIALLYWQATISTADARTSSVGS